MVTINKTWASNLVEMRGNKTQEEISSACHIPIRTYQRYESGVLPKTRRYVTALAKVHGVKETRLFLDPELVKAASPEDALKAAARAIELAQKLGPTLVARLAAMDDSEIRSLQSALAPGPIGNEPIPKDSDQESQSEHNDRKTRNK